MLPRLRCLAQLCDSGNPSGNEDGFCIDETYALVLDGATGLGDSVLNGSASDASWFVERFANCLAQARRKEHATLAALRQALEAVAQAWRDQVKKDLPMYRLPSAGMVLVALEGDELVMVRLGDCELFAQYVPGQYESDFEISRVFSNSPLHDLDRHALQAVTALRDSGYLLSEALREIRPMLQAHRDQLNTPSGYAALSVARLEQMVPDVKRVPVNTVKRLLLVSDGFSAAWQLYGLDSPARWLATETPQATLNDLLYRLRETERQDPEGQHFPRFKCHDDATAVLLEITPSV